MGYSEIISHNRQVNHLFSALLELTYGCNLHCFFCYNDVELKGKMLARDQYLRLMHELRELGALFLTLSGGEPLTHQDFFFLGGRARKLGFSVRIKSNGHALSRVLAKRLKEEVDPFIVEISLHGACAETHDRQTRVPGSFDRMLRNIGTMLALGHRVSLNTALTRWNEREFEGMFRIADGFGVPLRFDTQVTPRDNGDREPLKLAPSAEAVEALLRYRHTRRGTAVPEGKASLSEGKQGLGSADSKKHCGAGASFIAIDPYGTVFPCVQWRRAIGSLHEQSLKEIWFDNAELEDVRKENARAFIQQQALGPNALAAGFCPGYAETVSGDATMIYPIAELRRKLAGRVTG